MSSLLEKIADELLAITQINLFLQTGGLVLQVLTLVAFVLFCMLLARLWFRFFEFPKTLRQCKKATNLAGFTLVENSAQLALQQSMSLIRTTINVCPLLGLVGTVVGMIEIFDVIALKGVSSAQLLAAGVAKAILPTMAGMVIAISAMFIFAYIQRWVVKQRRVLTKLSLTWHGHKHEI
ncbi:MAG: MotA/TolQ/ExbB proton channel family protein [Oceanospirillaceae bacterium]